MQWTIATKIFFCYCYWLKLRMIITIISLCYSKPLHCPFSPVSPLRGDPVLSETRSKKWITVNPVFDVASSIIVLLFTKVGAASIKGLINVIACLASSCKYRRWGANPMENVASNTGFRILSTFSPRYRHYSIITIFYNHNIYTSDTCGNRAIATGKARPKASVQVIAFSGRCHRGFFFRKAVLLKWNQKSLREGMNPQKQQE